MSLAAVAGPLRTAAGIARSLGIYYAPGRRARLDRMLGRFVDPGDLAFDLGAHVGDRVASLRRLGARVVAVEPQPALARTLRLLFGRDRGVVIEEVAVGAAGGRVSLQINIDNPTVSTASAAFIAAADGAPGWQGQRWGLCLDVAATTLDALIARHGEPRFCKIDVEGFEAEVLRGLSRPLAALSFEFTTIQRAVAADALAELARLGAYRYNASVGESQRLAHDHWRDAAGIRAWLDALPDSANSGDIYAVRADARMVSGA